MLIRMNNRVFYMLGQISVVDIYGADAVAIINNLTTNDVKSLPVGQGRETFVTDVRGKTLGHVFLFRQSEAVRLIGPAGQSERMVQHIDRYTIREDATPTIRDNDFRCIVLSPAAASVAGIDPGQEWPSESSIRIADIDVCVYRTLWLGEETTVLLIPTESVQRGSSVSTRLFDRSSRGIGISLGPDSGRVSLVRNRFG